MRLRRSLLLVGVFVLVVAGLIWTFRPAPVVPVAVWGEAVGVDRRNPARSLAVMEELALDMAERRVELAAEGARWSFAAAELGLSVETEELLAAVIRELQGRRWAPGAIRTPPPVRIDSERLEQALAPVLAALEREPQDALLRLRGDEPVIEPHVIGRRIDRDRLAALLMDWFRAGGPSLLLAVPLRDELPAITATTVEQMGLRRLIAEATTAYDPTIPRAENVQRAAAAFDGLVFKPGQILSYTGIVGPIGTDTGWKEAYVIVNGELVSGVGGGVCQVSSTFYGAVLRAGFEILERHPHQLAVQYVEPGLDAAVAPGFEDLKVRNTTPGHILVRTEAEGGRVTVRLYGDLPPDTRFALETQTVGRIPFETVEVADDQMAPGERLVKSWGAEGYEVEAYRLTYQAGELVRRELLSRDAYRPVRQIELVGR